MAVDVSVQEEWTIEPELTEQPPRRITESGYPDYNKPSAVAFYGIGGVAALLGIILMFTGFAGAKIGLALFGILLALGGVFVAAWLVPQMTRRYLARAEHLITNGVPVMGRILTADNIGGDNSDARSLRYQISLPSGELTHRDVKADDRVLPKRIPANVTALMDIQSGDVELYCALPYRALPKKQAAARTVDTEPLVPTTTATTTGPTIGPTPQVPQTSPTGVPGRMGTIQVEATPEAERPRRKTEDEEPAKEEKSSGTAGLPWE